MAYSAGNELSSLAFDKIIGGALDAVLKAQSNASFTTVNFIKQTGFKLNENGEAMEPICVGFKYPIEIMKSARYVSNIMFFEYKKIIGNNSGVQIDVSTGQMNEFSSKWDWLMHIKIKIREQDINLLVEDKGGKEVRYLSLT